MGWWFIGENRTACGDSKCLADGCVNAPMPPVRGVGLASSSSAVVFRADHGPRIAIFLKSCVVRSASWRESVCAGGERTQEEKKKIGGGKKYHLLYDR